MRLIKDPSPKNEEGKKDYTEKNMNLKLEKLESVGSDLRNLSLSLFYESPIFYYALRFKF
jgi:hypothetical protein